MNITRISGIGRTNNQSQRNYTKMPCCKTSFGGPHTGTVAKSVSGGLSGLVSKMGDTIQSLALQKAALEKAFAEGKLNPIPGFEREENASGVFRWMQDSESPGFRFRFSRTGIEEGDEKFGLESIWNGARKLMSFQDKSYTLFS